jgi:8-oxo-dGTP pyrophosphatase MutT (NUDIX family)
MEINMENYRNAAGCIVFNEDKLLLLRRSKLETSQHGLYELPGGKQEENMSLMDTARIETEEESGLVVKVIQALKPHIDHEMKKVYHGYLAIIEGDDTIKLSEEHDEYKWVSLKEALSLSEPLSHHAEYLFRQIV